MRFFKQLLNEPLVHFSLVGALLYGTVSLVEQKHAEQSARAIHISEQRIAQLANLYQQQFGQPPNVTTLDKLVQNDIEEEVLMREAIKLGLNEDDEVIRRRLAQKMRFLIEDLQAPDTPTDDQLETYLSTNADAYTIPAKISFRHVYFTERDGKTDAVTRGKHVLENSSASIESTSGDPFPDRYHYVHYSREQIARVFGHSPAVAALMQAKTGEWFGPVRSGYGWHLFFVEAKSPAYQPTLAEIKDKLVRDYLHDAREQLNEKAWEQLAVHYDIVSEGGLRP